MTPTNVIARPRRGYLPAYRHASARLYQRYGISIGEAEYVSLCQVLAAGLLEYRITRAHTHGRQEIAFKLRGRSVRAIWAPQTGVIVTFLERPTPPSRRHCRDDRPRRRHQRGGAKHWRYQQWE